MTRVIKASVSSISPVAGAADAQVGAQSGVRGVFVRMTPFRIALGGVLLLTALRLAALYSTSLELYPDEAQYWLWSRHLAFGYFSKPPMVAWLIRMTTAIGGDGEPWVRLSAPLLHAAAALALYKAGERLYDDRTGLLAAAVYILMPAVQLSSGVIATDAPLMAFLAFSLWAYAVLATETRRGVADCAAAAFGAALALAALSKYAAAYAMGGAVLHALWSPSMRRQWTPPRLGLAICVGVLIVAPNIVWNVDHHFRTLAHTAANADWKNAKPGRSALQTAVGKIEDPRGLLGFLAAQFAVFGPVFFAALLVGGGLWWRRRRSLWAVEPDRLLLCFILPPLVLVVAQAAISRANANWAAPAYVAGSVLSAAWLLRARAWVWIAAGLLLQGIAAGLFLIAAVWGPLATAMHLDNSFKVARGWRATTDWLRGEAEAAARSRPLTAVAVDDRFVFNAVAYYGRGKPLPAPLVMWVRQSRPQNQAETEAPLTPSLGGRVLMADVWDNYRQEAARDFRRAGAVRTVAIPLDRRRDRRLSAFVGEGFAPRPRDPVTGLPTPP